MFLDKTRQDKTRQDKTRHDTTRHDTTRHDTTRQDKTRQDKTRQAKPRQDKTRQDKTRQDKTRQDKTRQDKTRQDKMQGIGLNSNHTAHLHRFSKTAWSSSLGRSVDLAKIPRPRRTLDGWLLACEPWRGQREMCNITHETWWCWRLAGRWWSLTFS